MDKLTTPFYRIKEEHLLYDIKLLQESLDENWGKYVCAYSVKTNSLPWLLVYLKNHGFYAEVVSELEYDLVSKLGFEDRYIIYNGPIKNPEIIEKILLGDGIVNMDSSQEPDWIEALSTRYPDRKFSVGLRVNFDIGASCPEEELAGEDGGRFGYCYENGELGKVIERMNALPNVNIGGLHLHSSTKSRTVEVYGVLAEKAGNIAKEYKLKLDYVDMGGGYFGGREDRPGYPQYFKEIAGKLGQYFDSSQTAIIAEPGVSLISRAITFETSVKDIKKIRNQCYVVIDGSRMNLNPQVTRHIYPHHMEYLDGDPLEEIRESQWICGFTCMEYDRLFELTKEHGLQIGDRIIFDTAGGYTMCLNPLFINYLPRVYVEKKDNSLFMAREAWDNREYLQKNFWK